MLTTQPRRFTFCHARRITDDAVLYTLLPSEALRFQAACRARDRLTDVRPCRLTPSLTEVLVERVVRLTVRGVA